MILSTYGNCQDFVSLPDYPAHAKPVQMPKPAKRPKGTQTFEYTLRGVDLVCELDWQEASGDGWHEPREPADAQLCEAFHNGGDIYELLGDDDRAEIETAFLEQEPEDY